MNIIIAAGSLIIGLNIFDSKNARADLEVQLMQQNHYDGVLSNDWNTLLGQQISQHTAMSMSRSALEMSLCFLKRNSHNDN